MPYLVNVVVFYGGSYHLGTKYNIQFEWKDRGEVTLDKKGKLKFPYNTEEESAVYSFKLYKRKRLVTSYIGQTKNLKTRLHKNYRSPSVRQKTSTRINEALAAHLREKSNYIIVSTIKTATISDEIIPLSSSVNRLLIENIAIFHEQKVGIRLLNKVTQS